MPSDWKPDPASIESVRYELQRRLPLARDVARKKRQELKDIHAVSVLKQTLTVCLPILPSEVAELVRSHLQAIDDAYKAPSHMNERSSEQLQPDQRNRF